MMRTATLCLCVLVCAGATAAMAADMPLPYKAPPPVYTSDWSGFYIGIHGGGGWLNDPGSGNDVFFGALGGTVNLPFSGFNGSGGLVGGHAGYNWQYWRSVVGGIELDASFADIKGSTTVTNATAVGTATETFSATVKSLASARARLGWLPFNWLLIYGTGGLAWERLENGNMTSFVAGIASFSNSSVTPISRFGFVGGVGAEAMLFGSSNWLGRVEYLHYDFGNQGSFSNSGGNNTSTGNQTVDVVRGAVTFKFSP